jgi:LacI family transcriptional regulator
MNVTVKDIARICGVSIGTVNRALNNRPGINPGTKARIMNIANELSYRPHLMARSLVKGETKILGVVMLNLYNHFFAQLVDSIERRAKECNYSVFLTLSYDNKEEEKKCLDQLVGRTVDGIILFSINRGTEYIRYLRTLNTPLVTVVNHVHRSFPLIAIDDNAAIRDAVRFIVSRGYTTIIYLSPETYTSKQSRIYAQEQRLLGFRQTVKETTRLNHFVIMESAAFPDRIVSLLSKKDQRTAILCTTDTIALEVLLQLKQKRLRVPEDIGLMGFDNIDVLRFVSPGLTTVNYPIQDIATRAVDCLLSQIRGEGVPEKLILEHDIVERDSL